MTARPDRSTPLVALFQDHVWQPFVDAGEPSDRWPQVTAALNRQRDLWARAMVPALGVAMQRQVDATRREVVNRELHDAAPDRTA